MKKSFLAVLVVAAAAALSPAAAQDANPKFYLEGGQVVERFAAVETDLAAVKKENADLKGVVAKLAKDVADLKAGNVIAVGPGGEIGADPVTIPLTPVKAAAPCVCGSACTCAEGTCPGGCPTQPIQFRQVCGPNGCKLVPVAAAAPTACYAPGQGPTCPQSAPAACPSCPPAAAPAGPLFSVRPKLFPRAQGFFQAHRPHLFGRLFGGGCCGG